MSVDGFIFLINIHFGEKVRFSFRRTFNSPIVFEFKTRRGRFIAIIVLFYAMSS